MTKPCSNCKTHTYISPRYSGLTHLCSECLSTFQYKKKRSRETTDTQQTYPLRRSKARDGEWFIAILRARYVLQNHNTIEVNIYQYVVDVNNKFLNGKHPISIGPDPLSEADKKILNEMRSLHIVKAMITVFKWRSVCKN